MAELDRLEPPKSVLSSWTQDHKDVVPFVALGFAVLYGFGWLIETMLYGTIQVASVSVPRENTVSAAFFFFAGPFVLPLFVALGNWVDQRRVGLTSGFALSFMLSWLSAFLVKFARPTFGVIFYSFTTYGTCALLFLLILAVDASLRRRNRRDAKVRFWLSWSAATMILASLYGTRVLKWLPTEMGGLSVSQVLLTIKPDNDKLSLMPLRAYLIASDDKGIIIAPRYGYHEGDLVFGEVRDNGVARIPWERVQRIEAPSNDLLHPWPVGATLARPSNGKVDPAGGRAIEPPQAPPPSAKPPGK